jgi:hypothetical protein
LADFLSAKTLFALVRGGGSAPNTAILEFAGALGVTG